MPVGKAFFIDGDFYSAGTGQTESLKREIALFKDGFRSLQKSRSRYVMDIRGGKTAAFDTGQGPFGFPLLINDAFYDHIHSTAVLDESGRVYYFKQKGSERVLFANKNPLWSFKGFYGFPIEAGQALPLRSADDSRADDSRADDPKVADSRGTVDSREDVDSRIENRTSVYCKSKPGRGGPGACVSVACVSGACVLSGGGAQACRSLEPAGGACLNSACEGERRILP